MCDEEPNSLESILSHLSSKTNQIVCDREFVSCVKEDLDILLATNGNICVVFPRLKPVFLRVLRHQAAIFDLSVFCVGINPTDPAQALAVCRKTFLRDEIKRVKIESNRNMETKIHRKTTKRETDIKVGRRGKPTQLYYVPPAQRGSNRKSEEVVKEKSKTKTEFPLFDITQPSTSAVIDTPTPVDIETEEPLELPVDTEQDLEAKIENLSLEETSSCDVLKTEENAIQNEEEEPTTDIENPISTEESNVSEISVTEEILQELTEPTEPVETPNQPNETNNSHLIISANKEVEKDSELDNESEEIRRAIVNINRKSRSLIKYIKNDYTLQINENVSDSNQTDVNKEADVSSWEDLFDDEGDIQKQYFDEITRRVGDNVKVMKASHDYSDYQNESVQDLEHVIELFDFPSTFRTQDLIQLYSNVHSDSMYIRWCDETHALLVLSTPAQAQRALNIEHDVIKSRPLSQASSAATLAACSSDLKPAMRRPQTNMQTARRLISTHLGTKSALNKEVAEKERRALKDAREQRRQERQNEKDAWEGRPKKAVG